MISGKAAVETKKEMLVKSKNLWFLFGHNDKGSPQITHSAVVDDVMRFNFQFYITKCKLTSNELVWDKDCNKCVNMIF